MTRSVASVALALVVASGCAYDWAIGGGSLDAGFDAEQPDGGVSDGALEVSVDVSTGDGAKSCEALHADVDSARAGAKHCTSMPSDCATSMQDQCGCTLFIAQSSSGATASYKDAIAALKASGCPLGCGTCAAPPTQSLCTAGAGPDGGLTTVCNP